MQQVVHDDHPPAVPPVAPRRRRARGYSKSGFYALRTTLRTLGPRVIDQRTALGKQLARWKADLIADLGGPDAVSTQAAAIVDLAAKQKLLIDSIDAWLLVQPSLVNARKRVLLPVVKERQALADGLARYLGMLGLDRRVQPVEDLAQYLARREREQAAEAAKATTVETPITPTTE